MTFRRAFTLIELLVVIAIIAILAAILFPVFARAKAAAKDSVTMSNTKQLGMGFAIYEADADDVIPPATHSVGGEGTLGGWAFIAKLNANPTRFDVSKGVVFPYVKNAGVYISPLDKDASRSGLSFAINGCLSVRPIGSGVIPSQSATASAAPAQQMLLTEEGINSFGTDDGYFDPTNSFVAWHSGGTAVLFVDNHTKIVKAKDRFAELVYGDASKTNCE